MQNCVISLVFLYPNSNYTSLDSQRRILNNDLKYVNVADKIEVHTALEFKNCNF